MSGPNDSRLPGLALALDADRMRELVSASLEARRNGEVVEALKIRSVQYRPGRKAAVTYAARMRPGSGGRSRRRLLAVLVLPPGDRPRGAPVAFVADLGVSVYTYPSDPWLPALARASDPVAMCRALYDARGDIDMRPRRVFVERLGYTPFSRAAIGVEVLGEKRSSGIPQIRRLVVKLDAQRSASELFARNWAVWRAGGHALPLVPPVTVLSGVGAFVQERLDGTRLSDLAGDSRLAKWSRQTARAIAGFHRLEVPLRTTRSPKREAEAVQGWGRLLSAIRQDRQVHVAAVCANVAAALERDARITGVVHADLHPANLLVCRDRVHLIDIDNVARGDCALDAGRFLSALRTTSYRLHGRADGLADAGQAFLDCFLRCSGLSEARVRLFEAACLIVSAATGFRLQRATWRESADALLDEAELALRRYEKTRAAAISVPATAQAVTPTVSARRDDTRWATDGPFMRAVLDEPVRRAYGADLTSCRAVARRDSGSRKRFRYHLCGRRDGEAWRLTLDGVLRSDRAGRGAARRATKVADAMGRHGSSLLPRAVAFVAELGLRVNERVSGAPFLSRIDRSAASPAHAVERLADDLHLLQQLQLELDRDYSLESLYDRLERSTRRAVDRGAVVVGAVRRILEPIRECTDALRPRRRPTLWRLDPEKLRCSDGGLVLADVDDVVLSHPGLDAADLLARWCLYGLLDGSPDATADVRERFRTRYLQRTGMAREELDVLQAVATLHLACTKSTPSAAPKVLLARAADLLHGARAVGA